jgi:hypothetical protein
MELSLLFKANTVTYNIETLFQLFVLESNPVTRAKTKYSNPQRILHQHY